MDDFRVVLRQNESQRPSRPGPALRIDRSQVLTLQQSRITRTEASQHFVAATLLLMGYPQAKRVGIVGGGVSGIAAAKASEKASSSSSITPRNTALRW